MIRPFLTWKHIVIVILGILYIFVLFHSYASIVEGATDCPSFVESVIVEGQIEAIENEDPERTKERAVHYGKGEAVMKIVSRYVHPRIFAKEKERLLPLFRTEEDVVMEGGKIVTIEKEGDHHYKVIMSSDIRKDLVEAILLNSLSPDSVVVIASEKSLGKPLRTSFLESELTRNLKRKGYRVTGCRTADKADAGIRSHHEPLNRESVKKLGIYFMAGTVMVCSADASFSEKTMEIYSSHATGRVLVYRPGSTQGPLSIARRGVKGFGSNESKSGIDALQKISFVMANETVKLMTSKRQYKMVSGK